MKTTLLTVILFGFIGSTKASPGQMGQFSRSIVGKYVFVKEGSFYDKTKRSGSCGTGLTVKYFNDGSGECQTGIYTSKYNDVTFCNVDQAPLAGSKISGVIPHSDEEISFISGRVDENTIQSWGLQMKKTDIGIDLVYLDDATGNEANKVISVCKFKKVQ